MNYTKDKIIDDVRIALHYGKREEQWMCECNQAFNVDDIISGNIESAAYKVCEAASLEKLGAGTSFAGAIEWEDTHGWLLLPPDFMRLIAFKMSDWERVATHAITADSKQYALQHSRYAGLRGCPQRPVCAAVVRSEGMALEFYSCRSPSATISLAQYMPMPKLTEGGVLSFPTALYPALIEEIANRCR